MKVQGDYAVFSTGRKVYTNCGIIGIAPDLDVREGYDGGFPAWKSYPEDDALTKEEREELADYMIALWQRFRVADAPLEDHLEF